MDRSSVMSSISRKRGAQTVEEYIANQFGLQFTELVLLLSAEQQAEDSLEDNSVNHSVLASDRKMILMRNKRF